MECLQAPHFYLEKYIVQGPSISGFITSKPLKKASLVVEGCEITPRAVFPIPGEIL